MKLARQLLSFGTVGVFATLAHVGVASLLIESAAFNGYLANAFGAGAAFTASFLGNANFTFSTNRTLWSSARRYIWISLFSLTVTSIIMAFTKYNDLSTFAYVAIVLATVPPTTFCLAKLWVFSLVTTSGTPSGLKKQPRLGSSSADH